MSLLEVERLDVRFATPDGDVQAVRGLSFALEAGETLGIVGESGSGKSQSMLSLLGLLADNGRAAGQARFGQRNLLALTELALRKVRGREISMIFQDPMTSLNPYLTIGAQMSMALRAHERISRRAADARCIEMLEAVAIPEPRTRLKRFPHELSGGMRQRVMIATSLLLKPRVLIADEPTTALDVTVQAQILDLLKDLKRQFDTAIILITHDLGVIAGIADRVLVMRSGVAEEEGSAAEVFYRPRSDYTRALLAAVPRLDLDEHAAPTTRGEREPPSRALVDGHDLAVRFAVPGAGWWSRQRVLRAVDGVDITLSPGETLGVVGESGSGKSTLARAILKLVPLAAGRISLFGRDVTAASRAEVRPLRAELQMVFQDPLAALNPRMTVGEIVSEPLWTHRPDLSKKSVRSEVVEVLHRVGLGGTELNRYPHEFSGGQCQRIGIARALVLKPKVIVCDEAVSALDVSIQAQIIELLLDLRRELDLALIFIAHDLAVVQRLSDRVMVMYLGAVMEVAPATALYTHPNHPYTRALISAVPLPDPDAERSRPREILRGEIPSPLAPPSGCRFRTRCRLAAERCALEVPRLRSFRSGLVACHRAEELAKLVG